MARGVPFTYPTFECLQKLRSFTLELCPKHRTSPRQVVNKTRRRRRRRRRSSSCTTIDESWLSISRRSAVTL